MPVLTFAIWTLIKVSGENSHAVAAAMCGHGPQQWLFVTKPMCARVLWALLFTLLFNHSQACLFTATLLQVSELPDQRTGQTVKRDVILQLWDDAHVNTHKLARHQLQLKGQLAREKCKCRF